ncbi:glycosyltransferase 87 family protein [Rhodococcus sp. p52]|uniref:glycosyltransferase 87 family protein n=1 Tax=Rhodococcus sp. p52 TaxID=935199 RepID=UPI000B2D8DCC|nr:glycosyltransferase 87 family protein [Rhodococcus sp. p52]
MQHRQYGHGPAGDEHLPRWWPAGAMVVAALAFLAHDRLLGWHDHYGLFGNAVDAVVYRHGGMTVRTSEPLYNFVLFDLLPFTYPPFAALVFVPLSMLTVAGTMIAVHLTNFVLLYLTVWLSWRALGYQDTTRLRIVSGALAVACTWLEPVRMSIWLGQINLLLLVLVLWDLSRPEASRLRGIGVGVAAGLKLTPALFIVYLAVVRQWRAAVVAAGTFAATIVVGFVVIFTDAWTYFTDAIIRSDRIGLISSPANQSIRGILARTLHTDEPSMWLWLICAAVVAAAGLSAAALAQRHGEQLLALTLCGLTAPMVSPFSWGHHWVWTVPLLVLCLDRARRRRRWWGYLLPIAAALPLVAWYRSYPDGVVAIGTFMTPAEPVLRTVAQCAYPLIFAVAVTAVLLAYGRRTPPAGAAVCDAGSTDRPAAPRSTPPILPSSPARSSGHQDTDTTTSETRRDRGHDPAPPVS